MNNTPEQLQASGILSGVINAIIFLVTLALVISFFRKDGQWNAARGRRIFRNFTSQSNALCAVASLLVCISLVATGDIPQWVWILKYLGTVTVTVTMITVFLLAALRGDSLKQLLKEADYFMHLFTPVLALASFCGPERRGMTFGVAMLGLIPVILYGTLYMSMILFAPEGKKWEDRYGLNVHWKWPVSCSVMVAGTFVVCVGLWLIQNA